MSLSPGTKLGPYEIVSPIGAGGMGEVYKARDTRLDREVAIKVLPSHLSKNADLKQRFEREARAISSLNHPHICTLHDIGQEGEIEYLVLEYLEGETLSKRLEKGALPMPELLKTAIQIADGLDRAHRSGIVHRDLKPGNIVLTKGGAKLLDFGLAKPNHSVMGMSGAALSAAATMTSPASPITQEGMVVGTYQYMAPEQLEGKEADPRSDIFSFGSVLYEMATGKRAFDGKSSISVMSAILEKEPEPISASHPLAPAALDHIVQRALAKDPEERWQSAGDIKGELQWLSGQPHSGAVPVLKGMPAASRMSGLRIAAIAAVGILLAFAAGWTMRPRTPQPTIRAVIIPPDRISLDVKGDYAGPAVISPDGQFVAFAGHGDNSQKAIWVRPIASMAAQRLVGTEGCSFPFWSPDSKWIGFFAENKLKKIAAGGGPALTLADAINPRGGTWSVDDVILYAPNFQGGLFRISAKGGTPAEATKLARSQTTHRWPYFLPDGKGFLYLAVSHSGAADGALGIYFATLDGKTNKMVMPNDSGAQYANGHIFYHVGTALMAQPFNDSKGELQGEAAAVVDRLQHDAGVWRTLFSVAQNGSLIYQAGDSGSLGSELTWMDRTGKKLGKIGERELYIDPRLSPDGTTIAVTRGDPVQDIWTIDLRRNVNTRLTFGGSTHLTPSWSPDGKYVAYSVGSQTKGGNCIRYRLANGGGDEIPIGDTKLPESMTVAGGVVSCASPQWTPDGRYMLFVRGTGPSDTAIYGVDMQSTDRKPFLAISPDNPSAAIIELRISPNGRWIAYTSNESGRLEVYLTRFNGPKGRWQVSTNAGSFPNWRKDGKEFFFMDPQGAIYSVPISETGETIHVGTPERLFQANVSAVGVTFDITGDGKKFLVNISPEQEQTPLVLVTNWMAELKK
ncbi:MAG TPA: protein kinase [Terriglobales bacterium]|nr:protein kinase [Terriglobales bacterium]